MKYVTTKEVFAEVPDEITLAIEISNCPCHCEGCHSDYLAHDIGTVLDKDTLLNIVSKHPIITCVAFMGGDSEPEKIAELAKTIKEKTGLKTCWYSGRELDLNCKPLQYLDYIKVGPFIKEKGPLDNPNTNQRFYRVVIFRNKKIQLEDKTYRFTTANSL